MSITLSQLEDKVFSMWCSGLVFCADHLFGVHGSCNF